MVENIVIFLHGTIDVLTFNISSKLLVEEGDSTFPSTELTKAISSFHGTSSVEANHI
jgi:hypothetical protein